MHNNGDNCNIVYVNTKSHLTGVKIFDVCHNTNVQCHVYSMETCAK